MWGILLIATANKDWAEFDPGPFSTRYFTLPDLGELLHVNKVKYPAAELRGI